MLTRMSISAQASEDVSKYLFQMKVLLYGDGGEASSSQENCQHLWWLTSPLRWRRKRASTGNHCPAFAGGLRE